MQKIIAIFADGLGFHYTDHDQVQESMKKIFPTVIPLRSIFGFSAGLVPSIWTSSYPKDHGYWLEWTLKKDYTLQPIKLRRLEWALSCLALYGIKRTQNLLGQNSTLEPSIPRSIKRFFSCNNVDMTKTFFSENPLSLFSLLEEKRISYHYSFCRKIEDMVLPTGKIHDVVIFSLGELDGLGHSYGPSSKLTIRRILKLLDAVQKMVKKTRYLCLFSDHGMFPINYRINLLKRIMKTRSRLGEDYLVFLDASMARFWFFTEYAREEIMSTLSGLPMGDFLSPKEISKEGLDFKTNSYGDHIYLMKPSIEVYPNYYHPIYPNYFRGLHGYSSSARNSYALFAATFDLRRKSGGLLDISPTILELLELMQPKNWKGRSLLH